MGWRMLDSSPDGAVRCKVPGTAELPGVPLQLPLKSHHHTKLAFCPQLQLPHPRDDQTARCRSFVCVEER